MDTNDRTKKKHQSGGLKILHEDKVLQEHWENTGKHYLAIISWPTLGKRGNDIILSG